MHRSLFVLMAAALALPACAGGGPQGPPVCNEVMIPALLLVYPAPNATSVSDSTGSLIFAGNPLTASGDTSAIELSVNDTAVATIPAFNPASTPLPSPDRSPLPPGPYVRVALPALSAHTTYAVTYQYTTAGSGPCAGTVNIPEGSFTTQ